MTKKRRTFPVQNLRNKGRLYGGRVPLQVDECGSTHDRMMASSASYTCTRKGVNIKLQPLFDLKKKKKKYNNNCSYFYF